MIKYFYFAGLLQKYRGFLSCQPDHFLYTCLKQKNIWNNFKKENRDKIKVFNANKFQRIQLLLQNIQLITSQPIELIKVWYNSVICYHQSSLCAFAILKVWNFSACH